MTTRDIKVVRDRTRHYLSDEVAACAGLRLADLQAFVAGTFFPSEQALEKLARRMKLEKLLENLS